MAIRGPFTVIYVKTRSVHPGCKAQAMRVHFREFCVFCVRHKALRERKQCHQFKFVLTIINQRVNI